MNKLIACFLILGAALPAAALSAFNNNSSTNPSITPASTGMIKCPQINVNNNILTKTPQTIADLGGESCQSGYFAGTIVGAAGGIGGGFFYTCPGDHPYLGGFTEGWGGIFTGALNATMTVSCCTKPQPPLSLTSGYQSGGHDTWAVGTICP